MAQITWKTLEEIEAEKNAPVPPTTEERLKNAEDTIVGLMDIIMMGGI